VDTFTPELAERLVTEMSRMGMDWTPAVYEAVRTNPFRRTESLPPFPSFEEMCDLLAQRPLFSHAVAPSHA
jgi:hypothetical protein